MPGITVTFMAPEALLDVASEAARADIQAAQIQPEALRSERRAETVLSMLETLLMPLPQRWRWGLEVKAGAWLRDVN